MFKSFKTREKLNIHSKMRRNFLSDSALKILEIMIYYYLDPGSGLTNTGTTFYPVYTRKYNNF